MSDRCPQVSAVIISLNEEADIARALASVAWCDEIVVVDSGSNDRTVEICEAHGCKVLHREFTGYGEQKAFAVTQAANDWVLSLDADEEVSPALKDEILEKLAQPGDCRGYYTPITTVLWDRVVRTGRRHTRPKLRLFDRRFGNFGKQLVHESVSLDGRTERLHHRMYNHSYNGITDYFEKFNRYTTATALECHNRGQRTHFFVAMVRLPLAFFQTYFMKGFVWEGPIGLTWSLFSSFYSVVKQLKLLELYRADALRKLAQGSARSKAEQPALQQSGEQPTGAGLDWMAAVRAAVRARSTTYALASCSVALAWLLMNLIGHDQSGDYSLVLFTSVAAIARFWGYLPALAATALAMMGLNYSAIPPTNAFTIPGPHGLAQLAIFGFLSLLISFLLSAPKRKLTR